MIAGSGEPEIEQAIDILCHAPATAHHISYQLAQAFVADDPPKALVDRLAVTFQKTDGDIRTMMDQLLHSPESGKLNTKIPNSKIRIATFSRLCALPTSP